MAIYIVGFPLKYGDFPVRYVSLPEGTWTSELKISVFFPDIGPCLPWILEFDTSDW